MLKVLIQSCPEIPRPSTSLPSALVSVNRSHWVWGCFSKKKVNLESKETDIQYKIQCNEFLWNLTFSIAECSWTWCCRSPSIKEVRLETIGLWWEPERRHFESCAHVVQESARVKVKGPITSQPISWMSVNIIPFEGWFNLFSRRPSTGSLFPLWPWFEIYLHALPGSCEKFPPWYLKKLTNAFMKIIKCKFSASSSEKWAVRSLRGGYCCDPRGPCTT